MSKKKSKKLIKGLRRMDGYESVVAGAAKPAMWAGYATAIGAVESLVNEGRGGKKTKKRRRKALKAIRKLAEHTGGKKALRIGKLPVRVKPDTQPVSEPDPQAAVARLIGTPDTEDPVTLSDETASNVVSIAAGRSTQPETPVAPGGLTGPLDGVGDNLQMIIGIGPVLQEKLHNLGVWHFEQIAAWTKEDIAWVDEHLSFHGRIEREEWVTQAATLSRGHDGKNGADLGSEPR